jgi:hypothetical protein
MVVDPAAYALAVDALSHGVASASRFYPAQNCTYLRDNVLIDSPTGLPAFLVGVFNDAVVVGNARNGVQAGACIV